MRLLCHIPTATLLVWLLIPHQTSGQTIEHIFFATTGDFGLDDNWSDPTKAPPEKPPGAVFEHNFHHYYINGDRTATISAGSPNGSHFEVLHLFVGDSPPDVVPSPGTLIMNGGPVPAPGEFGASLEVPALHEFRLGKICNLGGFDPCTGGGTVIMNGASDLLAPGLIVGERSRGELYIGPDARVRSVEDLGDGSFGRRDIRIGSFGPQRGEGVNRIEGNGLVEVAGELIGNTIYMPESDATGVLRVMPGGIVDIRGLDMTFQAFRPNRSSTLEIIGSGGSFTTTEGALQANHPTATIKFTADAGGVTPIVSVGLTGSADVENGNLVLNLDNFNFTPTSTLLLIDVVPDALFGPFGTVTFEGHTTATVNYDYANGDVFLSDFMSTAPPGVNGDYNNDGKVDAADYVVWRDHLGTTTTLPNDTTPGLVSPADYDVWRQNFGMMSGGGAGVTAIPEPVSLTATVLLMACCVGTHTLRRKREIPLRTGGRP